MIEPASAVDSDCQRAPIIGDRKKLPVLDKCERYITARLFSSFILGLFPGIFGEEFDNGTTW